MHVWNRFVYDGTRGRGKHTYKNIYTKFKSSALIHDFRGHFIALQEYHAYYTKTLVKLSNKQGDAHQFTIAAPKELFVPAAPREPLILARAEEGGLLIPFLKSKKANPLGTCLVTNMPSLNKPICSTTIITKSLFSPRALKITWAVGHAEKSWILKRMVSAIITVCIWQVACAVD